jgi:hypothetical protein
MRFVAVLVGSFILLMLAVLGPDPGAGQAIDPAERAWAVIRDTKDVAELEAFVRRFGDSFYTDLARLRIDDLKASGSSCGGVTAEKLASRAAGPLSAAEECALKSKDVFKECAQCPEMVVVPAGSFTMGSPDSEAGRVGDEGPQHTVTFARAFAAGRFAVTFDEWDACIADGGCNHFRPSDQGLGRGRRSVPEVSWNDAQSYVAWLSRKTGKTYRLLSEAEREYVTRAGTTTPFWWCASISTQQASIYTYGYGPNIAPRKQTVPVDSLQPNAITTVTRVRHRTVRLAQPGIADSVCSAAVPGTAIGRLPALPTASGLRPAVGSSSTSVSASGGRNRARRVHPNKRPPAVP